MSTAHTPGPWHAPFDDSLAWSQDLDVNIADKDGIKVATVNTDRLRECRANANLIAASPELLEALRAISSGTWNKADEHSHELDDALKQGDKAGFRYAFMSWAQKRARAAIEKVEV